jgi:integrase
MMARPRTGAVVKFRDERGRLRFKIGVTLPDGRRQWKRLKPDTSQARARDIAVSFNVRAQKDPTLQGDWSDGEPGETLTEYAKRWCDHRRKVGYASVRDDVSRLTHHILPKLGDRPIARVEPRDLEELVEDLDVKVRSGKISWKMAINVWGVVTSLFKDSCKSKALHLRARKDNPATDVSGPDRGGEKAKCFLYPSEVTMLLSCERISIRWRRLFAVAVYLGVRVGELQALEWPDFDLVHGKVTVHRATDRDTGETGSVKDENPRTFGIEPHLMPLLQLMHKEVGGKGRIIKMPRRRSLAQNLRKLLRKAGVERAELFIKDSTRIHLRFHDLRATCVTWMAVRGDTAERIMQRVGHEDWPTMKRYLRTAEALADSFGEVFGPLPASLVAGDFNPPTNRISPVVSASTNGRANGHLDPHLDPQLLKHVKLQRRGRDSNPRTPFSVARLASACLRPLGHLSRARIRGVSSAGLIAQFAGGVPEGPRPCWNVCRCHVVSAP